MQFRYQNYLTSLGGLIVLEEERLAKIISILKIKKNMTNFDLCKHLFCSQSTLRRDLIKLEKDDLIRRTHGGASINSNSNSEFSYFFRETEHIDEKEYICNIANDFITHGQALFLDPSSTVNKLCDHLEDYSNLIIVTNGLRNALHLSKVEQVKVFIVGGEVKNNSTAVLGEVAGTFLKNFKADIAFISCRGADLDGIYEADLNQALFKRHMIENAKKTILLCDSSKFNSTHFFKLTTYHNIDVLITNKKLDASYQEALEKCDCEIIY